MQVFRISLENLNELITFSLVMIALVLIGERIYIMQWKQILISQYFHSDIYWISSFNLLYLKELGRNLVLVRCYYAWDRQCLNPVIT